jgi:histidinol dehydrogenase
MALGPTESVVIADDSADPVRLAADLLIEAEHGTDSCTLLITTSASLAAATEVELVKQIALHEQRGAYNYQFHHGQVTSLERELGTACPAFGIASERLASEACEALRAAAAARAVTRP